LAAGVLALSAGSSRAAPATPQEIALANRLTWGATSQTVAEIAQMGRERWIARQLHPALDEPLPAPAQGEVDALALAHTPLAVLAVDLEAQNKAANAMADPVAKQAAKDLYQKAMNEAARAAATRSILRDLYSRDQLLEQMTWFWFNHFNVHLGKRDLRAMVGDYEDSAIRPHALGRFRDLLEATLRHPAMLRYLDNDQNAANHLNENYARELMELHTMGVGSGYTQTDVQELARILTGVGVDFNPTPPPMKPQLQALYIRSGLFEFNPNRHDFGDKVFLGHTIHGSGYAEVGQALDILAREPATARRVSTQLAVYLLGDAPSKTLIDRLTGVYQHTDGDIAAVLDALIHSPDFAASLGGKFKDPVHYALSAVRLAYDGKTVLNTGPIQGWLGRMGEGLYNHETPDGYPMTAPAWSGPGQFAVRFEIARQIGTGSAGLFKVDQQGAADQPAFPQLQNALYYAALSKEIAPATAGVLDQAVSPQEWNTLFLSSPEFMRR